MHTHTHIISYHMYKFLSDKQKVNKFELFLARPKKKKRHWKAKGVFGKGI